MPRSPSPAADSSASQAACAATSRVGVTLQALRLVGPGQPGQVQRYAVDQPVDVGADPDPGRQESVMHALMMPESQSWCEDVQGRVVAGRSGRRWCRARDQLSDRERDEHPGVAGGRGRRAGHPATPRARWPNAPSTCSGTGTSRSWWSSILVILGALFAAGRLARPPAVVGGGRRARAARGLRRRSRCCPSRRRPPPTRSRSLVGLATWLIVLSLLTERLRRIDRWPSRRRVRTSRPTTSPGPC